LFGRFALSSIGDYIMSKAIVAAQTAIPGVELPSAEVVLSPVELETIEQLGRDYWVAEDAKQVAERKLSQCDTALFDIVKGVGYRRFVAIRAAYVTGCRDKGAPTDEAASKVWERSINRIMSSCGFERPKSESEAAKRMAAKRAEQAAKFADKSDGELLETRTALLSKGDSKSVKAAMEIVKEIERREKPVLDAAETARKAVLEQLVKRAKELAKAGTDDADAKLTAALLALS
jgi:hypothetical protein